MSKHSLTAHSRILAPIDDISAPVQEASKLLPKWRVVNFSQVVKEFISGGTPSTKRQELWDGLIPWTTSAPIAEGDVLLNRAQRYITELGLQNSSSHLVPKGSLLVGTRVGVGKAVVNVIDVAISQDLTGVVLDLSQINGEFVVYQFKTKRVRDFFEGRKRGTTIKGISRFDLQALDLYLPPVSEQHTVAQVLGTVRSTIYVRRDELKLERERKTALMEYLFTHGTHNEPQKQTEIGYIPESWEIGRLRDVIQGDPQNGAFVKQPKLGTGTLYVNVYDIYQSPTINLNTVERMECEPSFVARYALKENDILFVRSSLKREGIGQCCLVREMEEPAIFDCHLINVSPNTATVAPLYLTYFFLSELGRNELIARSKTTTMTTINQNTLIDSLVPIPSLAEQRDITQVLEACDNKVAAVEQELSLLEELFRALLEELMTGRLSTLPLIEEGETHE